MLQASSNYTALADTSLVQRMMQNDEQAFKTLYDRYVDVLYRTAYKRLPVDYMVEDLVQEVFITLYHKRDSLQDVTNIKAWLFACLRNRILNEIRDSLLHEQHHKQIALTTEALTITHSAYDLSLLEAKFHAALAMLTDRCREVFLLSRMEKLSNKKIAERLNISVHAVEKHMTTALRVMHRELGSTLLLILYAQWQQ